MNDSMLFGDKMKFAIEVREANVKGNFYLRCWVENNSIGHFKRSGKLTYSFNEFKRFIDNKEEFYLDLFDSLSFVRIYNYLLEAILLLGPDGNRQEFEKCAKFYLIFGEQFSTDTSNLILLYKDDNVIFIFPQRKGRIISIKSANMPFSDFYQVVKEYLSFFDVTLS